MRIWQERSWGEPSAQRGSARSWRGSGTLGTVPRHTSDKHRAERNILNTKWHTQLTFLCGPVALLHTAPCLTRYWTDFLSLPKVFCQPHTQKTRRLAGTWILLKSTEEPTQLKPRSHLCQLCKYFQNTSENAHGETASAVGICDTALSVNRKCKE